MVLRNDTAAIVAGGPVDAGELASRLGNMLLRLPAVSCVVGHEWPRGTVADYFRPSGHEAPLDRLAAQIFFDVFTLRSREFVDKWFEPDQVQPWVMSGLSGLSAE